MERNNNPRLARTNNNPKLTEEVISALERDAFLRPQTLSMQVLADNDGVVTLVGSIESELDRKTAIDIASRVPGVNSVDNQLTLMGRESSVRPDADVQQEILEQIRADPTLERPERFHVRLHYGVAYVEGTVESEEEHDSVLAAIHRVPGVQGIEDRLELHIPMYKSQSPQR